MRIGQIGDPSEWQVTVVAVKQNDWQYLVHMGIRFKANTSPLVGIPVERDR